MRTSFKIAFLIVFLVFCFQLGAKIPFDSHIKIYDTLLTASGILFGVFGLWVSILYPTILEKSLYESGRTDNPTRISNKANQLLYPMFISLFLFLIMIFIEFLSHFLRALNLPSDIRILAKCISASMAAFIFLCLIDSIFQSMEQTEAFQTIITRNAILSDMKNRIISGICHNRKEKNEK